MINEEDAPQTLAKTIEEQFKALAFSKTPGNEHYGAGSKDELDRRNSRVDLFLQDDSVQDPELLPVRYGGDAIQDTVEKYDSMVNILLAQPNRTAEDDLLIDRIINKTGELFRYEELNLAMGSVATGERARHERLAADLSLEIMGGINQPAFNTLLNQTIDLADVSSAPYAQELKGLIQRQPEDEATRDMVELNERTREVIGNDLNVLFPGLEELLADYDGQESVSPEDAVPLLEKMEAIARLGDDWRVELSDAKSVSTSGAKKMITVGRNRVPFKNQRAVIALGVHEAFVHGGRSKGRSFPGYLDFEEGLATRLEQIITGEVRTPGVQYYLAIGLQAGADRGGIPRNYRETFEILWRRQALLMEKKGEDVDIQQARYQAQRQVQRTRRGGAIDTRDSSYFVGAQKAAAWLNEVAQLSEFDRRQKLLKVLINRYDPTDSEQEAMVGMGT